MVRLKALLLVVVLAAMALPVNGQADSAAAENISDATVTKAGAAFVHLLEIQQVYSTQLDAAQTPQAAKRLVNQMAGDAAKAIRDQGLSPAEFKHLMEVAESDPELRNRLLTAAKSAQ